MTAIRMFDADAVRERLDYPGCIAAMRDAMREFSSSTTPQPLREIVSVGDGKLFGLMPGLLEGERGFGAKLVSVYADPARPGRTEHRGLVVLFDRDTGEVAAIADAGSLTTIRTACATAVATDALARVDATTLGIFGIGALAEAHIAALPLVRPIERIVMWGRDPKRTRAFVAEMAATTTAEIVAATDARDAAACTIVCTLTGARDPILFGDWIRPGTHVNLVGSSHAGPVEVDSALVAMARYVADSRRSVLAAGAEFLDARAAGLIGDDHIVGEIGEVLLGRISGRTHVEQVTLYKSLGHIVQDLAAISYLASA
jgi:ornithine cyclodeaminase